MDPVTPLPTSGRADLAAPPVVTWALATLDRLVGRTRLLVQLDGATLAVVALLLAGGEGRGPVPGAPPVTAALVGAAGAAALLALVASPFVTWRRGLLRDPAAFRPDPLQLPGQPSALGLAVERRVRLHFVVWGLSMLAGLLLLAGLGGALLAAR